MRCSKTEEKNSQAHITKRAAVLSPRFAHWSMVVTPSRVALEGLRTKRSFVKTFIFLVWGYRGSHWTRRGDKSAQKRGHWGIGGDKYTWWGEEEEDRHHFEVGQIRAMLWRWQRDMSNHCPPLLSSYVPLVAIVFLRAIQELTMHVSLHETIRLRLNFRKKCISQQKSI